MKQPHKTRESMATAANRTQPLEAKSAAQQKQGSADHSPTTALKAWILRMHSDAFSLWAKIKLLLYVGHVCLSVAFGAPQFCVKSFI